MPSCRWFRLCMSKSHLSRSLEYLGFAINEDAHPVDISEHLCEVSIGLQCKAKVTVIVRYIDRLLEGPQHHSLNKVQVFTFLNGT